MTPSFTDPAAYRRWNAYFAEVDRVVARAGTDIHEIREDLAAHVVDSMAATGGAADELRNLEGALARLGRPADYLRPLLADALIEHGTRTYSPVTIARGLGHALLAGSRRTVVALTFGTGYLLLAIFTAMALLKPIWGEHIGLFRNADGTISAGIVASSPGARELLGWWSIPIALALAALLFILLTNRLRSRRAAVTGQFIHSN